MSTLTAVDEVVARAATYELLAVGYAYPTAARRTRLRDLAARLAPVVDTVHPDAAAALEPLAHAVGSAGVAEVEADFNRLFSGPVECIPHENAYEADIFRRQHVLADVAGFYRAFGFGLPDASRWQPDHIGVELEFCSVLLQRVALALDEGWEEPHAVAEVALRRFLAEHPGRWFETFTDLLAERAHARAYADLATATRRWLRAEIDALGLTPDPLRRIPSSDPTLPTCGGCPATPPAG